jgi:transposase
MYPTDLTDAQWQVIKDLLPDGERKRKYSLQSIVYALFYIVKTGCQWRMLPSDFPKWQVVYYYFKKWSELEIIDQMNQVVIEKKRLSMGRSECSHVAIIDCQSVKTTMVGGIRGYDGNKKIKGRKRHLAVDTQGNLLDCLVHSANQHESQTAELLLRKLKEEHLALKKVIADGGYRGALIALAKHK